MGGPPAGAGRAPRATGRGLTVEAPGRVVSEVGPAVAGALGTPSIPVCAGVLAAVAVPSV